MSTTGTASSVEYCDKLKNAILERAKEVMRVEMEKLVRERDSLTKEVEELRAKKTMESDKDSDHLYKSNKRHDLKGKEKVVEGSCGNGNPKYEEKNMKKQMEKVERESDELKMKKKKKKMESDVKIANFGGGREVRLSNKGAKYRLTRYCDLEIVNQIKRSLQRENLEIFEQSCFGHLLKIDHLEFQGQLILQLLLHLDVAASNNDKLVFKINDSHVEFGPRDFSLITGLRLGTSDEATTMRTRTSSYIHKNVFKGRRAQLLKYVKSAFLNICRVNNGGGELALKLAMLYFLYGALLDGNPRKQIELRYLHLIEDLEKFNAFPWGRVSYELLAASVLSARKRIEVSEFTGKKPSFTIHGFGFALQIWAYETMPSLANYCAIKANNSETLTPQILRWSTSKKRVSFENLKKFFKAGNKKHIKVLHGVEASAWEVEELSNESNPQPKKAKLLSEILHETTSSHAVSKVDAHSTLPTLASSDAAAKDVIIISDDDEDDGEATDSDNDSCSTTDMNKALGNGEEMIRKIQQRCGTF